MDDQIQPQENEGRGFPVAFLIGIGMVAVLLVAVWLMSGLQTKVEAPTKLPFGDAEQAYAKRIKFSKIQMSRATNFLGHEITVIAGVIENVGNQTLLEMEFEIEFRDFSDQVVLRETLRQFGKLGPPLEAGRDREFQLNFEKVPSSWNQQYPQFHITGLALQP